MSEKFDVIDIRLPSGTKATVKLPDPFTLADGVHLMNFLSAYIEEEINRPIQQAALPVAKVGEQEGGAA